MYRIEYLPEAVADLLEAEAYLYELNPAASDKFIEEVSKKTAALAENPLAYPVSRQDESLRCALFPYKYLCFYYVDEIAKTVRVYRVLHGMRDVQNIL